ncbi:hypothetical protein DES53_102631 [Roseimicrobium gellanilyticum]|uniref:Uncharacterized protein n=1 Tax=Roseimicrobium gellanilyticum TaxID=748857 RepID=A0A366HTK2_9BACT|nr:hypothetical protein [Roseimicrobium gellanilyticum]RBP46244.1 hypothetical protein DES53_102631 [Roseimicrobium gellanilyticum]
MQRHIWCETKKGLMHGRVEGAPEKAVPKWQRLFGLHRQGCFTQFDAVDATTALEAFDCFLASPKTFSVESAESMVIDYYASRWFADVTLDIWFSDSDLSVATVTKQVAREILLKVFSDTTDAELVAFIRQHATSLG